MRSGCAPPRAVRPHQAQRLHAACAGVPRRGCARAASVSASQQRKHAEAKKGEQRTRLQCGMRHWSPSHCAEAPRRDESGRRTRHAARPHQPPPLRGGGIFGVALSRTFPTMQALRPLLRPLRVFLSSHPAVPCTLPAPLGRRALHTGQNASATAPYLCASARALAPSLLTRSLLPGLRRAPAAHPHARVRWGSRKAGSTGFKTKSAVKKRFRITGGGALRRLSSGKRHLNLHKSSTRIHRLGACSAPAASAPACLHLPARLLTTCHDALPHNARTHLPPPQARKKPSKTRACESATCAFLGCPPF